MLKCSSLPLLIAEHLAVVQQRLAFSSFACTVSLDMQILLLQNLLLQIFSSFCCFFFLLCEEVNVQNMKASEKSTNTCSKLEHPWHATAQRDFVVVPNLCCTAPLQKLKTKNERASQPARQPSREATSQPCQKPKLGGQQAVCLE